MAFESRAYHYNFPQMPVGFISDAQYRALVGLESEFLRAWVRDEEWATFPEGTRKATIHRLAALGKVEIKLVKYVDEWAKCGRFGRLGYRRREYVSILARPTYPVERFSIVRVAKAESVKPKAR